MFFLPTNLRIEVFEINKQTKSINALGYKFKRVRVDFFTHSACCLASNAHWSKERASERASLLLNYYLSAEGAERSFCRHTHCWALATFAPKPH
jgi:hypothetical protein